MTRASLTRRERRTVLAGTAVVALLLFVFRVGPMWFAWREDAIELATANSLALANDRILLEQLPRTMAALDSRIALLSEQEPAPIAVREPAFAADAVAAFVHESGRLAGASLSRAETPASELLTAGAVRVSVVVHGQMDASTLAALIERLEFGPVLTWIRHMVVEAHDVEGTVDRPQLLEVRLDVEAIVLAAFSEGNS
jgi:hypothetical protein